jgi:hypothetical protein
MSKFPHIEFSKTWSSLTSAIKNLWDQEIRNPDRPHLENYQDLKEFALDAVNEAGFVDTIQESFLKLKESERESLVAELYLLEITSFVNAVDESNEKQKYTAFPDLLRSVPIILKSLNDILEDLPPWAKALISIFREIADIFKRN